MIALRLPSATQEQCTLDLKIRRFGLGELGVLGAGVGELAGCTEQVAQHFDRLRDVKTLVAAGHEAAHFRRGGIWGSLAAQGELRFCQGSVKLDVRKDLLAL